MSAGNERGQVFADKQERTVGRSKEDKKSQVHALTFWHLQSKRYSCALTCEIQNIDDTTCSIILLLSNLLLRSELCRACGSFLTAIG